MEISKLENELKAIKQQMDGLRDLEPSKRAEMGAKLNTRKREIEEKLFKAQKDARVREVNERLQGDALVDITVPLIGIASSQAPRKDVSLRGHLHPITRVQREVEEVFASMGFIIEEGAEIATEFENFDSLNTPKHHPARDMQDTFWLDNGQVLRTHTSTLQNYFLKKYGPEFRAISVGRCFRNEAVDASHENTFFQVEGMMVGKDISIANLIYFLKNALTAVFKKEIKVRLRPGFFSFVEPGFEFDMSCIFCDAKGCSVCKQSAWIEFCGCGMVHPNVLRMGGVDPEKYQGFAWGFGLTRLAMMKYGINEIRHFNSGNLEFLRSVK